MENKALVWLVVLVILFGLVNVGFTMNASDRIQAGVSQGELKTAIDGIVFPEYPGIEGINLSGIETRLDSLELEILEISDEDVSEETEAERLVWIEVNTRDFKRDVVKALNFYYNVSDEGLEVESYRHITDIVIKDTDFEMTGDEEANVTVDIKVYYYVDGDKDENERARFEEFVMFIEELDEDENFVDAEVVGCDELEVAKVY